MLLGGLQHNLFTPCTGYSAGITRIGSAARRPKAKPEAPPPAPKYLPLAADYSAFIPSCLSTAPTSWDLQAPRDLHVSSFLT